jgi:hypothetical protein
MTLQNAIPSGDVSAGSWTTAPLWSKVDEIDAIDESDSIRLAANTTGACRLGPLVRCAGTALGDPGVHTDHDISGRKEERIVDGFTGGETIPG